MMKRLPQKVNCLDARRHPYCSIVRSAKRFRSSFARYANAWSHLKCRHGDIGEEEIDPIQTPPETPEKKVTIHYEENATHYVEKLENIQLLEAELEGTQDREKRRHNSMLTMKLDIHVINSKRKGTEGLNEEITEGDAAYTFWDEHIPAESKKIKTFDEEFEDIMNATYPHGLYPKLSDFITTEQYENENATNLATAAAAIIPPPRK